MENVPFWASLVGSKVLYLFRPFTLGLRPLFWSSPPCLASGPASSQTGPQLSSLRSCSSASFEPLNTLWKRPGSVFVSCVGGRGRPWENSSKVQKNVTSSSLNKRALHHLFAQIFPLPMEKMLPLLPLLALLAWGWGSSGPLFFMLVVGSGPVVGAGHLGVLWPGALTQGPLEPCVAVAACPLWGWGLPFSRKNFLYNWKVTS